MELIERFAYYGVKVMLPVFMVDSFGKGVPELDQIQKGNIFAFALVIQSFVTIISGGFADRYGYKVNIAGIIFTIITGHHYENNSDKVVLARRYLVDVLHVDKAQVAAIPKSDL